MRIASLWQHLSGVHGTSRTRDQCNRRNRKQIRNLKIGELVKALNMPLRIIEKFAEQEKVVKSGRGKYKRKQNCFCKIDDF